MNIGRSSSFSKVWGGLDQVAQPPAGDNHLHVLNPELNFLQVGVRLGISLCVSAHLLGLQ